jgi:anhydro-N-acetylmuramic acid kinase
MIMDAVVSRLSSGRQSYDKNGSWAARGKVSVGLLDELMTHPFLRRKPPKTTGREEFGAPFVDGLMKRARVLRLNNEDIVATATMFTAASIAQAYKRFIFPKISVGQRKELQIILGGGGAKNPTLRSMLAELTSPSEVLTQDDLGNSNAAKEALAFAILAHETLNGQPSNVPSATGARRAAVLGKIIPT